MKTFKQYLIEIRNVLAQIEDKELDMEDFYRDDTKVAIGTTTIHTCGTAACILGYAALSPGITEGRQSPAMLWKELEAAEILLFGGYATHATDSLVSSDAKTRRQEAAEFLEPETINLFKHLTSDETTITDAIVYIDYLVGL